MRGASRAKGRRGQGPARGPRRALSNFPSLLAADPFKPLQDLKPDWVKDLLWVLSAGSHLLGHLKSNSNVLRFDWLSVLQVMAQGDTHLFAQNPTEAVLPTLQGLVAYFIHKLVKVENCF